jgi:hypothetical protein
MTSTTYGSTPRTSNTPDTDMAQSRSDNRTLLDPPIKYAQRLKSTSTRAFKPDTHLGITIQRAARRLRGWLGAGAG